MRWDGATLEGRFEAKYIPEPNSGCWLWIGGCTPSGYGNIWVNEIKRKDHAHRVSYRMHVGPIPSGMFVCHICDVPCCVNPAHLFLGTQTDNMADMRAKGRSATGDRNGSRTHPESYPKGENKSQAKLTNQQVLEIRAAVGATRRQLSEKYGIGQTYVSKVRHMRRRAEGLTLPA